MTRVDATARLQEHFGFSEFLPGQAEVIQRLLEGHSVAALFPTGGGKSLCYQLPALLLDGLTLVVSPLIALMKDQIDSLSRRGIRACRLDSTLTAEQYREIVQGVRGGEVQLLYVAPERFNNERFRELILGTQIALFAIDEAHCISEWGHNFRPDYLKLADFGRLAGAQRVLALTATATPQVQQDMARQFGIAAEHVIRTGFYRPNLTLLTTPVTPDQRDSYLLEQLQQRERGPTIVYVTLQRTAEEVAAKLAAAGLPARSYHAGMESDARHHVQDWFLASDRNIVVATIAFGMGIDKPDIRYVYHYNLPKSLENYSQEIGRAGRDGEPSVCEMLVAIEDLNVMENFVFGDTPTSEAVGKLVQTLFTSGEALDVSHSDLSRDCDIRPLVVRTLLTYLELEGYLEAGTPFYRSYRFLPKLSSQQILAKFRGERRDFLAGVFRQSVKSRNWFDIDLDRCAETLQVDRQRIVRALDFLAEQEMMTVATAGVRHPYRVRRRVEDREALRDDLVARMAEHERREIQRLQEVLALVTHDGCQASALGAHFGEPLETPCGHCRWCQERQPAELPSRPSPEIETRHLHAALQLRGEQPETFANPTTVARLLCGIKSPSLSRARLGKHRLFGALEQVPFERVLAAVREQWDR